MLDTPSHLLKGSYLQHTQTKRFTVLSYANLNIAFLLLHCGSLNLYMLRNTPDE